MQPSVQISTFLNSDILLSIAGRIWVLPETTGLVTFHIFELQQKLVTGKRCEPSCAGILEYRWEHPQR